MITKKNLLAILFIIIFFASCKKERSTSSSSSVNQDNCVTTMSFHQNDIIPGQYIVGYNTASVNARNMNKVGLDQLSNNILERNNINSSALQKSFGGEPGGFVAMLSEKEVLHLKNDPDIASIEPDRIVKLGSCFTVAAPTLITWNVKRVGYGNGIGKRAWIIDSGIDFSHPDLTVDSILSKSFLSNKPSASDENGHGTHVAGIIGAKNNSFGVLGVASGATLVSLRVLDKDGEGILSSIIQALSYVNTKGAAGDVVNMSLGADTTSQILNQQIKNTAARGIYITIPAGNDHTDTKNFSPANANGPNIYTVSAIDSLDNFASFSNYGADVDYATPGVRVLSTYMGNRYAYMSGTSMSAPHLAGLLLLKGNNLSVSGYAKNDPDSNPDPIAHY